MFATTVVAYRAAISCVVFRAANAPLALLISMSAIAGFADRETLATVASGAIIAPMIGLAVASAAAHTMCEIFRMSPSAIQAMQTCSYVASGACGTPMTCVVVCVTTSVA